MCLSIITLMCFGLTWDRQIKKEYRNLPVLERESNSSKVDRVTGWDRQNKYSECSNVPTDRRILDSMVRNYRELKAEWKMYDF